MLEVINLENNVCSILLQKNILCLQKNIFSIKFHFTLECSNITRKKTKQNTTSQPRLALLKGQHEKRCIRLDRLFQCSAVNQWYTDINKDWNIECLVICQKIVCYLLCVFSFCLSREKSSVQLHAQKPILKDMLVKGGPENFTLRNRKKIRAAANFYCRIWKAFNIF